MPVEIEFYFSLIGVPEDKKTCKDPELAIRKSEKITMIVAAKDFNLPIEEIEKYFKELKENSLCKNRITSGTAH